MPALSPIACLARPQPSNAHEHLPSAALAAAPARLQLAEAELGWRATRSLHDMCADHWRWCQANPKGFLTKPAAAAVAPAPAGPEGPDATDAEE